MNTSGLIELNIYRVNNDLEVTYNKKVNVTYGCSASAFSSALNQFDGYQNTKYTVTRKILASNGSELSDLTGAAKV